MNKVTEKKPYEDIFNHATATVPYYASGNPSHNDAQSVQQSWLQLPALSKSIVQHSPKDFISNKYLSEYHSGKLSNKKTSGSTGVCMGIYWSINDYARANREAWKYRQKWYGISMNDRYICFHTTLYSGNNFVDEEMPVLKKSVYLSFSKNLINEKIHDYFLLISSFAPVWMLAQPSVLYIMLNLATDEELGILKKLTYIELTGEFLQPGMLQYFKSKLPSTSISNMYGTTETGCISLQCPYGHNHIINNAYVEIYKDDKSICSSDNDSHNQYGEDGNIVLTGLKNTVMPLLKYKIGDYGNIKRVNCACGFKGCDIELKIGRTGEIITLPNGMQKPSFVLWYAIEAINSEYNNPIIRAYFKQKEDYSIEAYINLKKEFCNWEKSIFSSLTEYLYKSVSSEISYVIISASNENLNESNKQPFFETERKQR